MYIIQRLDEYKICLNLNGIVKGTFLQDKIQKEDSGAFEIITIALEK